MGRHERVGRGSFALDLVEKFDTPFASLTWGAIHGALMSIRNLGPSQEQAAKLFADLSSGERDKLASYPYRRLQSTLGIGQRVAIALRALFNGATPEAPKRAATKEPDLPDGRYSELGDGRYLFEWKEEDSPRSKVVTEETLQSLMRAYSRDGGNQSMQIVALEHGMTRREFSKIKSLYGATKDHEPFTLREMAEREFDDLAENQLTMKRRKLLRRVETEDYARTKAAARKWYALEADTLDPIAEVFRNITGADFAPSGESWEPSGNPDAYICAYQASDLHMGLGTDDGSYNRVIAKDRFMRGLVETLEHGRKAYGEPEYFLLYAGGDILHFDNYQGATSSNRHIQDMDGTPDTLFQDVVAMYMEGIDYLLSQGVRVRIVCVPGNHDEMHSRAVASACWAAYRNDPRVTFGNLTENYAYEVYGNSALIAHHGHGESTAKALGANLESWLRRQKLTTLWRYAVTGNLHQVHIHEDGGTMLIQQPSPAGKDRYSKLKGYTTSREATLGMYFGRTEGLLSLRYIGF